MASTKKIIAVVGATGAQGGGLAKAILEEGEGSEFQVRALTRRPDSVKAKDLDALGAEVVAADVGDEASLVKAFEGAYGVFCVTFFWEHMDPARELQEAKNQAEAAKKAGVKHVVWSTLEDTRKFMDLSDTRMPTLKGKYKVPHFDSKGEADQHFIDLGVPTTMVRTSFYLENFINFGMGPQKGADGNLAIIFPMADKPLPIILGEDIGRCVLGIFKRPEYIGRTVGLAAEHLTGAEICEKFSKALGQTVTYVAMEPADYAKLGFPGADDIANMFQFKRDFVEDFCGARDPKEAHALNANMQKLDQWLAANAQKIPIS